MREWRKSCLYIFTQILDPRLSREGWYLQVSDRFTGSDHRAIMFQLHTTSRTAKMTRIPKREKWAPATFSSESFLCFLEGTSVEGTAVVRGRSLSQTITAACDASMSTKTNHSGRTPVYWWNEKIAVIRKESLRTRKLHQRTVRGPLYEELTTSNEQKRKKLKTVIKTPKRKCWQDFCEEIQFLYPKTYPKINNISVQWQLCWNLKSTSIHDRIILYENLMQIFKPKA